MFRHTGLGILYTLWLAINAKRGSVMMPLFAFIVLSFYLKLNKSTVNIKTLLAGIVPRPDGP